MTGIDAVNASQAAHADGEPVNAVVTVLTNALYLAAAPTFAAMALLTYMSGGNGDMMCSVAHGAWPLSGMVPMYALMSGFHSGPWLKWIIRSWIAFRETLRVSRTSAPPCGLVRPLRRARLHARDAAVL